MKSKDLHPRLLYPAKLSSRMEGQIKCFPEKVKLKEFIITKPLFYEMLKGLTKKKKVKTMNSKVTTNSQLSTTKSRKNKLGKQLEQEQSHRDEDHMEGYQQGGVGGERGKRYRE